MNGIDHNCCLLFINTVSYLKLDWLQLEYYFIYAYYSELYPATNCWAANILVFEKYINNGNSIQPPDTDISHHMTQSPHSPSASCELSVSAVNNQHEAAAQSSPIPSNPETTSASLWVLINKGLNNSTTRAKSTASADQSCSFSVIRVYHMISLMKQHIEQVSLKMQYALY